MFSLGSSKEESRTGRVQNDRVVQAKSRPFDEKLKEMKDQVIRGKAYLTFTPANSSSHLVKELKVRIKEVERALSQSMKDSRVSKGYDFRLLILFIFKYLVKFSLLQFATENQRSFML